MSSTNEPWFMTERSEALAGVLLTSREDVRVLFERKRDSLLDLLVKIDTGDPLSTQLLVVQVKASQSSDPNDWMPDLEPIFHMRAPDFPAYVRLRGERAGEQGLLCVGG